MSTDQAVMVAIIAVLVIAWLIQPTKRMVGGIFVRDRKGRMTLVLTPVPRGKRKKKRKRR